ncbi:group-specific protein [Evansella tamaricis]|uniref:Group-specific protein n=1 Tax=Evansella tamaricis TaxID=2069301 RepID=A0ABS6JNS2_9BACI|nr:group-specific protein [Evansella tamaricis]MBU9714457.1 group-specific protein [Evansella tamaricis]
MINLQIDDAEVKNMYMNKLDERMRELDLELVYWDRKELLRRTCMSWNFIQEQFFYDEEFKKLRFKVGSKWFFKARETQQFLLKWLEENGKVS